MATNIEKSNVEEIFDLSTAQKGRLFHYLKDSGGNKFNVQIVLQIDGRLDIDVMEQAVRSVQANNEVLRSVFNWEVTGKPLQIILKDNPAEFDLQDLCEKELDQVPALQELYLDQDREKRFDLNKLPVRFGIIKLSADAYLMRITHHQILYDGWSTGVLLKEIFSAYDLLLGKNRPVFPVKPSYKEIQKSIRQKAGNTDGKQYWPSYLADYEVANLSAKKAGSDNKDRLRTIQIIHRDLDLEAFSARNKVTRASIIYAAYGILLQKYLYTKDIVFGTTVSYREGGMRNAENVMGNFINTIPLRLKDTGNQSLLETVVGVHTALINRSSHNHTSYFDIKQLMGLGPAEELFDSVIAIENYPIENNIQNGHREYQVRLHSVYENLALPLHITVFFDEGLRMDLAYDTYCLSEELVTAFSRQFPAIIKAILEEPSKLTGSVSILTEKERDEILYTFNQPGILYPEEKTIVNLFEEQVEKNPEKCAVFSDCESITYRELNTRINQLARFLVNNGVTRGSIVALLMNRSIDFVINVFAIVKAGALYLPIDPGYPDERVNYMLENSGTAVLLTKEDLAVSRDLKQGARVFYYDKLRGELSGISGSNPEEQQAEDIYVIYTSGSTGVPKGVIGTQKGLLNRLYWGWDTYPTKEDEIFCLKTNISFVDHVVEVFAPLLSGVSVRVFSEGEMLDIPKMYSLLIREKITRITLVPSYLKMLIDLKREQDLANHSLKYVFCSGEYLPFHVAKAFYREFSDAMLVNIYGSTEVSADASYYNVDRFYVEDVLKYFKNQIYQDKLDSNSVTSPNVRLEEIARRFKNSNLPDYPIGIEQYFSDFQREVLPYSVNTASPRFIGHMTSILPDYVHDVSKLISQLNQNLVKIETSKSLTFIEREAIAMLHRLFYCFPATFYDEHIQKINSNLGVITSGGSTANMSALLSARNKALYPMPGHSSSQQSIYQLLTGKGYTDVVIIGSSLMHYSFHKAVSLLGIGTSNILYVKNDADGKMEIADLQRKIDHCRDQNVLVMAIIGIAGATETGSIDPLRQIGEIASKNGIHFHVDAAWGGLLRFSDRYSKLLDGIELADSITFCGHKQLFLPQGISVCLFKDPHQLNYNSTVANYQANRDSYDFGRVTLEGSKSGLSLCLHASLRILGKKGYELLLDRGIKLATTFAKIIRATAGFELISVHINIINYRYIPLEYRDRYALGLRPQENELINEVNTKIQETQFLRGRTFVSKTKIRRADDQPIVVFRAVLSNPVTTRQDLEYVIKDQFLIIEELFGETNSLDLVSGKDPSIEEDTNEAQEEKTQKIPIGRPISNATVLILDTNKELQPIGVPGELYVSGAGVARGYLNNEALTAEKFVANPYQPGERMYRTGDLARWLSNGSIEYLGRMDDQVKIRGHRIELGEVESRLLNHPGIKEAVVLARQREGDKYLVGYYVSDAEIPAEEIGNYLSSVLPDYMLPAYYVRLDSIPLTANGKTDRKRLPEPGITTGQGYVAPADEREKKLVEIWSDILQLDKGAIGVTTSFFKIGGHSLKAIALANKISKEFNVEMPLKEVFSRQDIRGLSAFIAQTSKSVFSAIQKSARKEEYGLSPAQSRMYFLYQFDKASLAYNMPKVFELEGELDTSRLTGAFQKLIARHDSLRTSFHITDGEAAQRIRTEVDFILERHEAPVSKAGSIIREFVRPFDLGMAPLLRAGLIKLPDARHLLLVDMHHIITDGASQGVLLKDFMALYNDEELPELRLQYTDYSEWQRQSAQQEQLSAQRDFWMQEFEEAVPVLELPADYPRPEVKSHKGSYQTFTLGKGETSRLKALGEESGATLFMTLLSVLNILLSKLSNQEDITIGTPIEGREHADLEGIMGLFVNTLALRNYPKGGLSFREFLSAVKEKALSCFGNQSYPYEELVNELNILRDTSRNPLFDVMFTLQGFEHKELAIPGLILKPYDNDHGITKFDLTLTAIESAGALDFTFEYSTELFEAQTIERFIAYFKQIVAIVTADADKKISRIDVLSAAERHQLLYEFNDTRADYPKDKTVTELFEEQAARTPDHIALFSNGNTLTYTQLRERVNQIAAFLRLHSPGGDIIAIFGDKNIDTIAALLAILKNGSAYLPVDTKYPEDRISYMLDDAGVKVILATVAVSERIRGEYAVYDVASIGAATEEAGAGVARSRSSADLAYVMYTSGTTGMPKGVMITHQNISGLVTNTNFPKFNESTRLLWTTALTFDATTLQIWGSLLNGGCVYLYPDSALLDSALLGDAIEACEINTMALPPALYNLHARESADIFKGVKYLMMGGDIPNPSLINKVRDRFPIIQIGNMYGPTEITNTSTYYVIEKAYETSIPIGKPINNSVAYILNDYQQPVPMGVSGEIYVGGFGVARGYLNNEKLTSEKFIADPYRPGERIYRTGDLGRWNRDGDIEFLGRKDDQVKIRGFRIEPGEIESRLAGYPGVKEALVIPFERRGEKYLAGYYVSGKEIPSTDIQTYLAAALPEYMIPACFVHLTGIPLNSNGKTDRKRLPEPEFTAGENYVAPANEQEEKLAAIWSEVLQLDKEVISVRESFFRLGGHSLKAMTLVNKISKELNVDIPLKEIFSRQDIRGLSEFITQASRFDFSAIPKAARKEEYVLSSAQRRMYFLYEFDTASLAYNMPVVVELEGDIDTDRLTGVFKKLIARHDSLRTSFHMTYGKMVQRVHAEVDFMLERWEATAAEAGSIIRDFVRPFDLGHAPLIRAGLIQLSDQVHLLLVDMHHIITDGVSQGVLIRDFMALYNDEKLPELRLQYTDYSEWQQGAEQQEGLSAQQDFWMQEFSEAAPVLELPADYPRPAVKSYKGSTLSFSTGREETDRLKALGEESGATLFMTLLAVLNILLNKLSNQEDITIGAPVAGRGHADLEGIMGLFVNTLALRNYPKGELSFREFLSEVRKKTLSCFENQSYPYEELVNALNIPRDTSRNPLCDVGFTLHAYDHKELVIPGLKLKPYDNYHGIAKFDLILTVIESAGALRFTFEYSTELFEAQTIERFVGYFRRIVTAVTKDADIPLSRIDILSEKERYRVLYELNDTSSDYPKDKTITELFEAQAARTPDNIAVCCNGNTLTYTQLWERVDQIAAFLRLHSPGGDVIAIFGDRAIDTIAALLAILKNGSAYLPLDIKYPEDRISYMLNDAEVTIVLANVPVPERIRVEYAVYDISSIGSATGEGRGRVARSRSSADLAYVMYTSGTTGLPKGVMITHQNISRLVINTNFAEFNESTRLLWVAALTFDPTTLEVWGSLLNGGAVYLYPDSTLLNPGLLGEAIQACGINTMVFTTALYNLHAREKAEIFKGVKYLMIGGEMPNPSLIDRVRNRFPAIQISNVYGPTENTTVSTYHLIEKSYESITPIGRPISNSVAYVLNDQQQPVAMGVSGELYVGGDGVARGYLKNEKLTSEKFIADPYRPGERLYRTGDLARWNRDGDLEFLGRKDAQVKIRGYRIELGEIESHLIGHPQIKEAVVVALERHGDKYLAGYYVSENDLSTEDLQAYLSASLPDFMLPSCYVRLSSIPLNSHGKTDRRRLPEPEFTAGEGYAAPANEQEERLVEIWSEVLQLNKEAISVDASFFSLGGHSLKAIALANRISKELNVNLPLREIFSRQDVRSLSAFITQASKSSYSAIQRSVGKEDYVLSSAQSRMYFLYEFDPSSLAYNLPMVIELEGELDKGRLEMAFGKLIARHESLRTSFEQGNGQVNQRIHAGVDFLPEWHAAAVAEAGSIIREFIRPFDLGHAPLIRTGLIQLSDQAHLLLVDMHHIITDGVSQGILIRDFMALYNDETLPEVKLQYKDYSEWQQGPEQQERLSAQRDFWMREFAEEVSILDLPADHPRPVVKNHAGSNLSFTIGREETSRLKALGEEAGATLFMTILSVLNVLLSKLSNQENIVVGTQVAGRSHADLDNVVGVFINTLALRNYAGGELSFTGFLAQVKEKALSCFDHQLYPYEDLIRDLEVRRDTSRNPLFDVMFMSDNQIRDELVIPGLKGKAYDYNHGYAKLDLTLTMVESVDVLHFNFEYSTELFEVQTIERFIGYFRRIVAAVTENPGVLLSRIDILSAPERHQVLHEFNDTGADYAKDKTITQLFEAEVSKYPERTAVVFNGVELSYATLNERSNRLARYLLSAGIVPGCVVGLLLDRSQEMIVSMLGVLKAGAGYLPIDPALPEQRVRYMLDQSGCSLLLAHRHYLERHSAYLPVKDIQSEELYAGEAGNVGVMITPNDLAYCIFTSGSTGLPKGVLMGHRSVVNLVFGLHDRVYHYYPGRALRVALLASYAFDASVQQIFGALLQGHSLYICGDEERKDGNRLIGFYNDNSIDLSDGTPTHLRLLVNALDRETGVGSLSSWILAGEFLPKELVQEFYQKNTGKAVRLFNFYGPTETCVDSTSFEIVGEKLDHYASIPIGKPLPNERTYITDRWGNPVAIGVAGELCIAGDGLAHRYMGDSALTMEKFPEDWIPGEKRVYRTGDLVRWLPDGQIAYQGRMDQQVKIRGYRIELAEIERQLLAHEAVKSAIVQVKELNEEKCLVGYYVADIPVVLSELRDHLAKILPDYMIPAYFVRLEAIPLTVNGKLDHKALPAIEIDLQGSYEGPADAIEEQLVAIWSEILKLEKGSISVETSFFELGGHSLTATMLANKIAKQLHVEVPLKEIFFRQDIRSLGAFIKQTSTSSFATIAKAPIKEYYKLSSVQQRMYFLYEFDTSSLAYNLPQIVELEGYVDKNKVEGIFRQLIYRHEILRTSIVTIDEEVFQKVGVDVPFSMDYFDLGAADAGAVIEQFIRPFDLRQPPLIRVGLLKKAEGSHLLLMDMHHIITDGVSEGILIKDFMALYNGEKLPEVKLQYKDYSEWQQAPEQRERLLAQRDFWRGEFAGELSVLDLPVDHPRSAIKGYAGSSLGFTIGREETARLKVLGEETGATLFMTLLAVFNVLLSKLCNQQDITIGTGVAGRNHADLEKVMGMFVNTLALRNYPKGELPFRTFLSQVKERSLLCFEHQQYPYEDLIGELQLERDTSRNPLFDVMFTFQNFGQEELIIPGLTLHSYDKSILHTSKFDLELTVIDSHDELYLQMEYSTELFDAGTIERFIGYFKRIVTVVSENADRTLAGIDILSARERRELLHELNGKKADYALDKTFVALFESQVRLTPDSVAAADEIQEVTYSVLNQRANRIANALLLNGLVLEMPVAVVCNRGVDMLIAIIGILKAGGVYLPLSADLPVERIMEVFADARPQFLMTTSTIVGEDMLNSLSGITPGLHVICVDCLDEKVGSAANPSIGPGPDNLAYILYTSGTTGVSKGVMIEHKGMLNHLLAKRDALQLDSASVVAQNASETFDISIWQFLCALITGGKTVIYSKARVLDPENLIDQLSEDGVTVLEVVPSYLAVLLGYLEQGAAADIFSTLEYLLVTGEILHKSLVKRWFNVYPDIPMVNAYGPTEASDDITHCQLDDVPATSTIPIGRVLPNLKVYIVNDSFGLCPIGVKGEILVSGVGVGRGYLNQPEKTAAAFLKDPFSDDEKMRMYRTGDVGRWLPDGNIEFWGRKDSQVKINGHRIELGEIESRLAGHPEIKEAVVIARQREGEKYLAGYYVADMEIPARELSKYLSRVLPDYMLPAYYVHLDSLPLTSNGKTDRTRLPEPEISAGEEYVAPANEVEEQLVEIWTGILKIGKEDMSVTKSFFELGGNSINAIKLTHKINQELNINLKLADLYNRNSIRDLAGHILIIKQIQVEHQDVDEIIEVKL